MLEALIPVFGVGKGDSFSLDQLMHFVGKAFGNSNADARAAATRVTTLVWPLRWPVYVSFVYTLAAAACVCTDMPFSTCIQ